MAPVCSKPPGTPTIQPRNGTAETISLPGKPLLITSVDAEETFNWSKPFSRDVTDISSMRQQHVAQRIFAKFGVVPIYLVTYPVAASPDGYRPLLDYLQDGALEIGAQLHTWVTPPFSEELTVRSSFQCNLAPEIEDQKIRLLTEKIEENLGTRPRVFRAGRYGIGLHSAGILKQLGYLIDSSIVPHFSFVEAGGPDFTGCQSLPFWIDDEKTLLEIPITCELVGRAPAAVKQGVEPFLFRGRGVASIRSALARCGIIERIKLTPEGQSLEDAKRLVKGAVKMNRSLFTLSYHSPSLVPGSTPYVRSEADRERMLAWLDGFYEFFFGEIGGAPVTMGDFYQSLKAGVSA